MKLTTEAREAIFDARRQARAATRDARKQANRRLVRARIAAAKAGAETRARTRTAKSNLSGKAVGAAGAVGLAAGYFLDPESGKRRRHDLRDRTLALVRRGAERSRKEAEYQANDQTLADRVKSEIFQPDDAPKGSVNVNVERGVVYLRGEVKRPDEIRELVEQAGKVDGVAGVENLLHTA